MLIDIIINGMVTGSMYALLTIGFALVFSVARIVNMAHTAFYMVSAFLVFIGVQMINVGYLTSLVFSISITTILGIISYRLFFDRVKEHQEAIMIISIALALAFQEILFLIFSGTYRGVPSLFRGYIEVAGTRILYQQIAAIVTSALVLGGLWLWLLKARFGKATRAVSQDPEIANVMGINVSTIYMVVMSISVGLAALSGAIMAPLRSVSPLMWADPIVVVLASVVLGGLGSIGGAVIGAMILGYVETIIIFLVPGGAFLGGAASLCVMVIVLLIRPEGMFGVYFEEERL